MWEGDISPSHTLASNQGEKEKIGQSQATGEALLDGNKTVVTNSRHRQCFDGAERSGAERAPEGAATCGVRADRSVVVGVDDVNYGGVAMASAGCRSQGDREDEAGEGKKHER